MNTFIRFFFEFISIFMDGMKMMFRGIVEGFKQVINIKNYIEIINDYKENGEGSFNCRGRNSDVLRQGRFLG